MHPLVVESAASRRRWVELINERFVPLQISAASSDGLWGEVTTTHIGHLQASLVCSRPQVFTRPASLVGVGRQLMAIGVVEAGHGYLEQNGSQCRVDAGSFAWYDTSRPFTWAFPEDYELRVYAWPRYSLDVGDDELTALTACAVSTKAGVGRLIAPSLRAVFDEDEAAVTPRVAQRLADELAELGVTAAIAASHHDSPHDLADDVLTQIQMFIEENLDNPDLSVSLIADHFFISTRTVNRIFAKAGFSASTWVKERRLQRARKMVKASSGRGTPLSVIAHDCGFASSASFSRDFTRRFGQTPTQYRSAQR